MPSYSQRRWVENPKGGLVKAENGGKGGEKPTPTAAPATLFSFSFIVPCCWRYRKMRLAKWVGWVGKTGVKWVEIEPRPNHYIETGPEGLRGVFEGFGGWEWPTILPNTCCFLIHTHTHPENFLRSLFLAANKKYIYIYIYICAACCFRPPLPFSPPPPLHYNASLSLLYIPDFFPLFIWVCSFLFFYL